MQKIILLIIVVPFLLLACILFPIPNGTPDAVSGTPSGTASSHNGTSSGTPTATASVLRGCWNVRRAADVGSEILRVVCDANVVPQKFEAGWFYSDEYGGYICARSIGWNVDCGE